MKEMMNELLKNYKYVAIGAAIGTVVTSATTASINIARAIKNKMKQEKGLPEGYFKEF